VPGSFHHLDVRVVLRDAAPGGAPTERSVDPCRLVRLDTDIETASRLVPPTLVVLEPDGDGVLLTVRALPDEFDRIALHLLALPCALEGAERDTRPGALR
jgi:hypothetical protein